MKTIKKILLTAIVIVLSIPAVFAQSEQTVSESKQPPKSTEMVVGEIDHAFTYEVVYDVYINGIYRKTEHKKFDFTEKSALDRLMESAKKKYAESYPMFSLRNFKYKKEIYRSSDDETLRNYCDYYYQLSASIVVPNPKAILSEAIDKALQDVREGSRIAIDQIRVTSGVNREDYKDEVIEMLIHKGFKVVAKEYLEKLYEEQQGQQSGIYNERTTVKENNFSAVGYYFNVKLTEKNLRVQVINVSTGEYEGNVTVKL